MLNTTFKLATAVALICAMSFAGCTRTSGISNINSSQSLERPKPLQPAPTESVQTNELPPPSNLDGQLQTSEQQFDANGNPLNEGLTEPNTEIAAVNPVEVKPEPSAPQKLTKSSVLGTYDVFTPTGKCRLILPLTQNPDKTFRAAVLRCPPPVMSTVRAWNVKSNQLVLYDASGNAVANFNKIGEKKFAGATNTGTQISLVLGN